MSGHDVAIWHSTERLDEPTMQIRQPIAAPWKPNERGRITPGLAAVSPQLNFQKRW
jgi:hypothetical protein